MKVEDSQTNRVEDDHEAMHFERVHSVDHLNKPNTDMNDSQPNGDYNFLEPPMILIDKDSQSDGRDQFETQVTQEGPPPVGPLLPKNMYGSQKASVLNSRRTGGTVESELLYSQKGDQMMQLMATT